MAAVEENWQTKRSTIVERTTFIFNNQLLSDVKFVVPASIGESESPGGGGTLGISGWGCAAGTLEPLAYTRASSAEFCYPLRE